MLTGGDEKHAIPAGAVKERENRKAPQREPKIRCHREFAMSGFQDH